ncbi:MAG: GAF domain-containing protein [Anaerolineales bacterium]|nr:GAF domain-containing protein [Anaerolineales bacterium]
MAREVADALLAEPFDHDARALRSSALQLGARLGKIDKLNAETSSKLADVLVAQMTRDLYPQELNILQPKLAVLIGGVTAGFSSSPNAEQAGQTDVSSDRHYERELEALGVIAQKLKYIGSTLGESLDLEHVLQEIVESAHQTIPSIERAVFHLLDEKSNVLRPVAVSAVGVISKPSLAMRPGEGIAGYVLASGQMLNVADIQLDSRYVADETTGQGLHSLLVVPVQRKGLSLGTISVQSCTPNAFSAADEKLLAELAFRSTIAIENTRLYQQEREQRLWAEVLAEASAALTHSQGRHCAGQPACQHADDGVVCQSAGWRGDPVLGCRKQRLGRSTCNPHPGWQAGGDHDQSGSVHDGHAVKTV